MSEHLDDAREAIEAEEEDQAMEGESHPTRTFVAGLAIGALVGAGVALLFAPQSGVRTRRLFARKAKNFAKDAKDKYDDLKEKVHQARHHGDADDEE